MLDYDTSAELTAHFPDVELELLKTVFYLILLAVKKESANG